MNHYQPSSFCGNCGTVLDPNAKFCPSCGEQMTESVATPTAQKTSNASDVYQGHSIQPGAVQQDIAQKADSSEVEQHDGFNQDQMYNPAPSQNNQTKKTNVGLVAFIALAVIVLVLFIIAKISVFIILGALVCLALGLWVQQKLMNRGVAIGTVIWFLSALVCFLLFGVFSSSAVVPDVPSETVNTEIAPSAEDIEVAFGLYMILIPGGTVQQTQTLEIKKMDDLPPALSEFDPVCPAFDVSLGDLTQFDKPLIIEIPYDSEMLQEMEPTEGFIAVYYDEATGMWNDVPYEVDEANAVVRLVMYHLTTVQCYYSFWEGGAVYDNGTVKVVYKFSDSLNSKYIAYEKAVGQSETLKALPQFVLDLADRATTILNTYKNAGLSIPTQPRIYVTDGTSAYNSITGNILVSLNVATLNDPVGLMKRNLAHELFHISQQLEMGVLDYEATSMKNSSFWMEASADYMGNTGTWQLAGQEAVNNYDYYSLDFFKKSLYTMNGIHEYDAGNFVYFVQELFQATPKQMIDIGESYASFPDAFDAVYGSVYKLEEYYRHFLEYSISDGISHFQQSTNATLEKVIGNKVNLEFKLDDDGNSVFEQLEGSDSLSFSGAYTAGFCVFTVNCDTTLTITPNSNIILYIFDRTRQDKGFDLRVDAGSGVPTEIEFGKDSYILAAQVSERAGSINITYKAQPTMADVAGQWDIKVLTATDVEASEDLWVAMQEGFGYGKSGYLEQTNVELTAVLQDMHLLITPTDTENQYALGFNVASAELENYQFDNVTLVGNTITGDTKFGDLWASISLTVNGDQITGILRSQLRYTHNESVYIGTEIFELQATHRIPPEQ